MTVSDHSPPSFNAPDGPLSRDVIRVGGPERGAFLNGLLSQKVEDLPEGALCHGALLTPQGKIVETMMIGAASDALWVDVPAGRGAALAKRLMLYRLRAQVEIDQTSDHVIGTGRGPDGAILVAADPRHRHLGQRWLAPNTVKGAFADDALNAAEVALGIPAMGNGFDSGEVFPLDVNLDAISGIDHKKGCFVGQEVASRMFRKGSIRKRTWCVLGDDVKPGDDILMEDRVVGTVTAVHGPCALGIVRLDRINPEARSGVTREGRPVTISEPAYLREAP